MANERDFQEYAMSGDIKQINIGGVDYNNKAATFADLPQDYIAYSDLNTKALSGEYTAIYIGGTYAHNKAATQQYVDEAVIVAGGYTDANVLSLLNSGSVSSIYIGSNTDITNLVATRSYVDNSSSTYSDTDVQTLMSGGYISEMYIDKGNGASEVVTLEDLVTSNEAIPKLAKIFEITTTNSDLIISHSAANLHFTGTVDQTINIDSNELPVGFQVGLFSMTTNAVNISIDFGTVNGGTSLIDQIPQYSGLYITHWKQGEWVAG